MATLLDETDTIYQASDFNRQYRAILEAARAGVARVRDTDGTSLIVSREARWGALQCVTTAAANFMPLEAAVGHACDRRPELSEFGDWTWLRVFDHEELAEFVSEMREAIAIGAKEVSAAPVLDVLAAWRMTADSLEDPLSRETLLGPVDSAALEEVGRPE